MPDETAALLITLPGGFVNAVRRVRCDDPVFAAALRALDRGSRRRHRSTYTITAVLTVQQRRALHRESLLLPTLTAAETRAAVAGRRLLAAHL